MAGAVFLYAYKITPLPEALLNKAPGSFTIQDREGQPLRELLSANDTYAGPLRLADAPPALVQATLSAEDKRFFSHHGVDSLAMLRAVGQAIARREVHSGGSTITMQLLKVSDPRPRTIRTKLREALVAIKLERHWKKERILREYLSRIHYGNLRMGCVSAARYYFGKGLGDLSTAECAFLASLPWAPSRLNPYTNLDDALARQQWVLRKMKDNGYLTQEQLDRALAEKLDLRPAGNTFAAPHFVDMLLQQPEVRARMADANDRLRLRTTLDPQLQEFAENSLRQRLAPLRNRNVKNGSIVVLRNSTGEVLALVGSINYFAGRSGQVNGAWAPRSPGSALKPFTYLLAMEHGDNPASIAPDIPTEYVTETGIYVPQNYDRHFYGPMRYRAALANSLNIAAVRALERAGGPETLRARLEAWGISNLDTDSKRYGLGLTIGNAEVRLLELANAYATIARQGRYLPPRFVTLPGDPPLRRLASGSQVDRPESVALANARSANELPVPEATRVNCWLIADMLSDNFARTLTFGPRSWLYFDFPVAAKTGTSSDYRDNWCFGFTPEFTVGIWVGNFDGTPMHEVSGVAGAAPVMNDIMRELRQRYGTTWYPRPPEVTERSIHPITGHEIDPALAGRRPEPEAILERFWKEHLPRREQLTDYDSEGQVILPREYARWLETGDNWLGNRATAGEGILSAKGPRPPKILMPLPGSTYYLDPDLPDHGSLLTLQSDQVSAAHCTWSSPTLAIAPDPKSGQPQARLTPGRHEIIATDPTTGKSSTTWLQVEQL